MRLFWISPLVIFSALSATADAQVYEVVVLAPTPAYEHAWGFAAGSGSQGGYIRSISEFADHAALWSGTGSSVVDLHPAGKVWSTVSAIDGLQQVGGTYDGGFQHACVWAGSAASVIDLHPEGFLNSWATGAGGGKQVGWADGHAVMWSGTAASMVDLHRADWWSNSGLYGGGSSQQAGYVTPNESGGLHAAYWAGTAESGYDLHPAGYLDSFARDADGVQQVGWVQDTEARKAAVWSGSRGSLVVLDTFGFGSEAFGVGNGKQVGRMFFSPFSIRAVVWSSTASSYVDLHATLPAEYQSEYADSVANDIAEDGSIVGYAYNVVANRYDAILWRIPAPVGVFSGFLQPLNDPTAAPESVFKKNSTVLVKFRLTDASGSPITSETATISLARIAGTVDVPVNEGDFIAPADDGVFFRLIGDQYVYNLSTRSLQAGSRYRITATYGTASQTVTFALR